MIELRNLHYSYGDEPLLRDVNLKIEEGERIVLLGVNGSGKSTLLKIVNGLLFPKKGEYIYSGEKVEEKRFKDRAFRERFRKEVVLLFQNPEVMLFNATVYDEMAFSLRQLRLKEEEIRQRVLFWAERFDLISLLKKPPFELSLGQKQKLCLASLLVLQPRVLLLDEPTAHLDPKSVGWLVDLLWELSCTTVVSTHNLSLASELGDRLIVLGEDHCVLYDGEVNAFVRNREMLIKAGLMHTHKRRGGEDYHIHYFW